MSLDRIIELHNQIRSILLEHLDHPQVAYNLDKLKAASPAKIAHAVQWMEAFVDVRIYRILEVKKLVPQSMWDGYKNLGVNRGPYEVEQMYAAVKAMKEDWAHRPTILRKSGAIHETQNVNHKARHSKSPKRKRVQPSDSRPHEGDR